MAFAGSNPYGIFSGAFNSTSNGIQWGATGEAGSASLTANGEMADRVMSFAACGGKLYASIYDAIVVRTDGTNPSWKIFYQYSGPALPSRSSGFRGLTCVPNLNGSGSMLIAALEGNGDIYDIPLDGSQPTIELYTSNFLSTQLGDMGRVRHPRIQQYDRLPSIRSTSCPDLLIGLDSSTRGAIQMHMRGYYPTASFLIRHCNGAYGFRTIVDPSITPAPLALIDPHPGRIAIQRRPCGNALWGRIRRSWLAGAQYRLGLQGDSPMTNSTGRVAAEQRH